MIEGAYRTLWFSTKSDWDVVVVKCTIPAEATALYVAINNPNDGVDNYYEVEWAALYEGSYTAETMPEYHPKGYWAEFAECMRYFERLPLNLMMDNTNKLVIMDRTRVVKRIYPTTIANVKQSSEPGASVEFWYSDGDCIRGTITFASTGNQYWYGYLDISADL